MSLNPTVLDASALLALLQDEPGAERVVDLSSDAGAYVSAVNWAETLTKLVDAGQDAGEVVETLFREGLFSSIEVLPFDAALALEAARLRPLTRSFGLSLGDRACLALGVHHDLPVVTADRAWANLSLKIPVHLIR